jgi:hypothetical protein
MYTPRFSKLRRTARRPLPLLLGFLFVGCSQPAESETPSDGGTPSPDLATPSSGTVSGSRIRSHVSAPDKLTDRAVDLSGATLEALVPDSSGSQYSVIAGAGDASGGFSIPAVPLGSPYYLHLYSAAESPPHVYVQTSATRIDLGEYSGTRSDVVSGGGGSALSWGNVGGLDAWVAGDQLLYFSSDNGLYLYGSTPAAGTTTLGLTQSFANQPLSSAARNDGLYVLQLHQTGTVDGSPVQTVSRALSLPAFDMPDGATTTISSTQASFSQPPQQTVSFDYRRSQFVALQSGAAPAANLSTRITHQLYVCALLGGSALKYGFYSNSADLMAYNTTAATDVVLDQIRVGNPFPGSYGLFGYVSANFAASYTLPGATSSVSISAAATYVAPLADFTAGPVVPKIGAVTNFQINGQDAQTTTATVTTQPVLSWNSPQLGSASHYVVSVHQLYLRSGTQTAQKLLAQIHTTASRVVVPPGLLQAGEYYVFRVASQGRSGYDGARPFRGAIPLSTAATLSTLVTP